MPYPEPLLPKIEYKEEIVIGDLVGTSLHYYLLRLSTGPIEDPNNIRIRELCQPTKEFVGLSTNLLGIFELVHLSIKPTNRPRPDYWTKSDGSIDQSQIQYEEVDGREPIFIRVSGIHDSDISATKEAEQKTITVGLKVRLMHKPTKPNYWHLEVRIFNVENNQEYERDHLPVWVKNAIKKFVEFDICQKANGNPPAMHTTIPSDLFVDGPDEIDFTTV